MQVEPSAPADVFAAGIKEENPPVSWGSFPNGLRVLVVDDDPLCLKVIEQMLKRCNYEVQTCATAAAALEQLRDKSHGFDLVLSDVYMPDMDGFKLLEAIGLELELPVIMMSSNGEHSTVMRGVTHGAVDFLIKPVRIEELRNIWQHVIRRTSRHVTGQMQSSSEMDHDDTSEHEHCRKRKDAGRESASEREEESSASKKPRVVWSADMHLQFVQAVNQLGIDKAVPKKILELMKVEGLTRENVASHLQKYRLYLKRVQGVTNAAANMHAPPLQQAKVAAAAKAAAAVGVPTVAAGSSPQQLNGVTVPLAGIALAPQMVPVQPHPAVAVRLAQPQQSAATPFAAAAAVAPAPQPAAPGATAPAAAAAAAAAAAPAPAAPPVLQPVVLQQQGSAALPPAAGASQAPAAAAPALQPQPMPQGLLPATIMTAGMVPALQPGIAAMQMNAMMAANMGIGLPALGLGLGQPGGAGPLLGNLGAMGLPPPLGMGPMPGMQALPPNLQAMGLPGLHQLPGLAVGQGMLNPGDPNALMVAFQAMLAQGLPGAMPAAQAAVSGTTSAAMAHSSSAGTPPIAAVGLPAGAVLPSMPSMGSIPSMHVAPPLVSSSAAAAVPGSSSAAAAAAPPHSMPLPGDGPVQMEGLDGPMAAHRLLPDVTDFSSMFEDHLGGAGAGPPPLGVGDVGAGGVDDFLDMLLKG